MANEPRPNMSALHIIHLEDCDADAQLVEEQLRKGGVKAEIVRVRSEDAFAREITRPDLDVILSDCHCSNLDGFKALSLAREKRADVPFVFLCQALDHTWPCWQPMPPIRPRTLSGAAYCALLSSTRVS